MVIIRDGLHNDTRILTIKPNIHGQHMLVHVQNTRAQVWSTYASVTPKKLLNLPGYNIYIHTHIVSLTRVSQGEFMGSLSTHKQWYALEYYLHTFMIIFADLFHDLCHFLFGHIYKQGLCSVQLTCQPPHIYFVGSVMLSPF